MNYCQLLFDTKEKYLDLEALIDADSGRRLTYRELMEEVKKTAGLIESKGYTNGDVIATHLYNSIEAAVILLAIQYIGGVVCLIDPLFKPNEIIYYIEDSNAKCLFTHLKTTDMDTVVKEMTEVININEFGDELRDFVYADKKFYSYDENELAMLLYTSGSTSKPKGVMIPAGNFFVFLEKSYQSKYVHTEDDRFLVKVTCVIYIKYVINLTFSRAK